MEQHKFGGVIYPRLSVLAFTARLLLRSSVPVHFIFIKETNPALA